MCIQICALQLDERGRRKSSYRCQHANFVFKTEVAGEMEFLFSAYSAFKVGVSQTRYRYMSHRYMFGVLPISMDMSHRYMSGVLPINIDK